MLRRTLFALGFVTGAIGQRLRGQSRADLMRLAKESLANTPYKSAGIMQLGSAELVKILEDPDSSVFFKAKACQRLALIGDESTVSALAGLLPDPKLSHYARAALEPMPGPSADRVLREALGGLEGNLLIGVINSIAWRRDPEALVALASLRHGDDAHVASAATAAIRRIRRP